jgi:hypothetical protein
MLSPFPYIFACFSLSLLFRQSLLYDSQFNISIRTRLISTVARYLESIYGVQTPETADIMNNLSSTYYYQGRWKEAEELCLFALKMKTRELGKEHPDTVVCMGNFAANDSTSPDGPSLG